MRTRTFTWQLITYRPGLFLLNFLLWTAFHSIPVVFGILAKVREIDDLLHRAPGLGGLLREGHPEVTLAAMNGGNAMRHPKKSAAGRAERLAVIRESLGDGAVELYQHAAAHYPRARVGRDDLIDALALVWTARRIASGRHLRLPREARSDALGLPMHIHY